MEIPKSTYKISQNNSDLFEMQKAFIKNVQKYSDLTKKKTFVYKINSMKNKSFSMFLDKISMVSRWFNS